MKHYIDYMDHITADAKLHQSIMEKIENKQAPVNQNRRMMQFAATAACAAVILLSLWTVPNLLSNPVVGPPGVDCPNTPQNPAVITGTPSAAPTAAPAESLPPTEPDIYELFFNRAETCYQPDRAYALGYFTLPLDEDDFSTLNLPVTDHNRSFSGVAGFSAAGELYNVAIVCKNETSGYETAIEMERERVFVEYLYPEPVKVLTVHGVTVEAGFWQNGGSSMYYAFFTFGQTGYYLRVEEIAGDERAGDELTELVSLIINRGSADLNGITPEVIPEFRNDDLTLKEARSDTSFGALVPNTVPNGFGFESAIRSIHQWNDSLNLQYAGTGRAELRVTIRRPREDDWERIIDPAKTETYDLSLYPIPRSESVPRELWQIVDHPVFRIEDLTLELVMARAYFVEEAGDTSGDRMSFGVLYGDIVVEVTGKGAPPDEVYKMLSRMGDSTGQMND